MTTSVSLRASKILCSENKLFPVDRVFEKISSAKRITTASVKLRDRQSEEDWVFIDGKGMRG
jgi:hypothetical protein